MSVINHYRKGLALINFLQAARNRRSCCKALQNCIKRDTGGYRGEFLDLVRKAQKLMR